MKWWFSSWNLLLFSLSKVCRISSADCFISGFTASQSPQLRLRSIVGYTFRRHKLRFMSNAKLRTTTFLRYGSSSQKSAAHIFGNPDCILLSVCFQSCARLWRMILQIVFHINLLFLAWKRSLIFLHHRPKSALRHKPQCGIKLSISLT